MVSFVCLLHHLAKRRPYCTVTIMFYLTRWPLLLFSQILASVSAASIVAKPVLLSGNPASIFLGADLQSNYSIPPALRARHVAVAPEYFDGCVADEHKQSHRTTKLLPNPRSFSSYTSPHRMALWPASSTRV